MRRCGLGRRGGQRDLNRGKLEKRREEGDVSRSTGALRNGDLFFSKRHDESLMGVDDRHHPTASEFRFVSQKTGWRCLMTEGHDFSPKKPRTCIRYMLLFCPDAGCRAELPSPKRTPKKTSLAAGPLIIIQGTSIDPGIYYLRIPIAHRLPRPIVTYGSHLPIGKRRSGGPMVACQRL